MREPRHVNLDVFSPEEVMAVVRAAESEQDAAIYLTAAFTGLRRGELIALRWRDVDFAGCVIRVRASYAAGSLTTPKSGKLRSVPMAPQVAETLARLAGGATDDSLVFPGDHGGYLDGSALRRRYKLALERAGLRSLRFHDLRHTFGTRAIAKADILRVKEWMGHADVATTMRYLHYVPRPEDARLIGGRLRDRPATVRGAQLATVVAAGRWSGAPRGSGVEAAPPFVACLGDAGPIPSPPPSAVEGERPSLAPQPMGFQLLREPDHPLTRCTS
jgi:integrase